MGGGGRMGKDSRGRQAESVSCGNKSPGSEGLVGFLAQ